MSSGSPFAPVDWGAVAELVENLNRAVTSVSDIRAIGAKCAAGQAMAMISNDGVIVVELLGTQSGLELWIWIAAGFSAGAFRRAESAIEAIARDMGATSIAFRPVRRGWRRLVGPQWQRRGECLARAVHG